MAERSRGKGFRAIIAAAVGAAVVAGAAPALASGGGGVTAGGSCTGPSAAKLKAAHDDGRIEVQFEVDSNRAGQTWHVVLRDNGERFFSGDRVTQPPSGSFEVTKRTRNRAGSDTIRARATRRNGSETCTAHVTL